MDKPDVLFTPEQIAARIRQIGTEVARDFDGKEVCVVGLIKSCMIFMADLVRAIPLDMTCHFLRVSSLREGTAGGGADGHRLHDGNRLRGPPHPFARRHHRYRDNLEFSPRSHPGAPAA